MKVLVVTNMYPSKKKPFYGVFVKNQVESFHKLGYEVRVVSDKGEKSGKFHSLIKYLSLYFRTVFHMLFYSPDVIHCHYIFPTSLPVVLMKKIVKKPIFITSHRGDVFDMPYRNKLFFKMTKFCLEKADGIIAVSHEIENKIIDSFEIESKKINVIDMGFNLKAGNFVNNKSDKLEVIFIGISFSRKGGFELLQAISRDRLSLVNQSVIFKFIGEFPPEAQAFVDDHSLAELVQVLGFMPHNEAMKHLIMADIFVLPSKSEGLPVALLEAASVNTCIIATDVGDVGSFIKDRKTGVLVNVGDVLSLKNALLELVGNPELRFRLSKAALKKSKNYTSDYKTASLCKLYKRKLKSLQKC